MKDTLEKLKKEITAFIENAQASNKEFDHKLPYYSYLNRYVFDLQGHLHSELEKRSINRSLNPSIYSQSIAESMSIDFASNTGKKTDKDLMLPFLFYLCKHFNGDYKLADYITDFVYENREELSWEDIVMTQSGATRIYTNLRFALHQLRDLGLVKKEDEDGKTDLEPTVLGYLLFNMKEHRVNEDKRSSKLRYSYLELMDMLGEFKQSIHRKENMVEFEIRFPKLYQRYRENLGEIMYAFNKLFLETSIFSETGIHIPDKIFKDPLYTRLLQMLK